MKHSLDVVAVGVADERAEVSGVVLGPQPGRVQRFGAEFDRGVVERAHGALVGRLERDVDLAVGAEVRVGDPEVGLTVLAVADRDAEVHLPCEAQHAEHPVVELLGLTEIAAVDAQVVYHGAHPDIYSRFMSYDLVIRGGTIVDGLGGEPFVGDVAVSDGVIVAVGTVDGSAAREIDASGLLVTPGFVDLHTHYDGQAIWSDRLTPSSRHGVTTAVMGNCGVGFAPCRADDHDVLVDVMAGVEDIPGVVMADGLPWDWETFPEYLDALDARHRDIDVAAYLPHSPLRVYVMGQRGVDREPATADDLARMRALAKEAIEVGAVGFASSRFVMHKTSGGQQIPTYNAACEEISAIAQGVADGGGGLLQFVPDIPAGGYESVLGQVFEVGPEWPSRRRAGRLPNTIRPTPIDLPVNRIFCGFLSFAPTVSSDRDTGRSTSRRNRDSQMQYRSGWHRCRLFRTSCGSGNGRGCRCFQTSRPGRDPSECRKELR